MSSNSRQGKPRKDGGQFQTSTPNQARRGGGPAGGAWRGSQNNPSIMNYGANNARTPPTHSTPPPNNSNAANGTGPASQGKDSNYSSPSTASATTAATTSANGSATNIPPASYIGSLIVVTTKTGSRHEGTLVANEHVTHPGISLKDAKDLVNPGAPLVPTLFIPFQQLQHWSSAPATNAVKTNGSAVLDSFRTDTDISAGGTVRKERELQAWTPDALADGTQNLSLNDATFNNQNGSWDQFAANEKLFGVTTNFDEEFYTTPIDRNAVDFKEREKKAQQIADSITGAVSNNPHVREERGLENGNLNEEEKYGAVVRGPNAYVPPGARKPGDTNGTQVPKSVSQSNVPQVSVNGPDGTSVATVTTASTGNTATTSAASAKPDDSGVIASFREFVTTEKQKLVQKKQAMAKSEKDKKFADLIQFSSTFKLNKPIPADLVPILTKDEDKAKALVEKTQKDAGDTKARSIGTPITSQAPANGATPNGATARPAAQPAKPPVHTQTTVPSYRASVIQPIPPFKGSSTAKAAGSSKPAATSSAMTKTTSATKPDTASAAESSTQSSKKSFAAMQIPKIPPFDPSKRRAANDPKSSGPASAGPSSSNGANAGSPPNFRLNVNASSFRPNSTSFKPGASSTSGPTPSPKAKPGETSQPPNPFFGNRPVKKNGPVHVKDDFNPFRAGKVGDASSLSNQWTFSGKRFQSLFPVAPQPQHPPQAPPVGPSTSFEEDPAVAAANQQAVAAQQVRVNAPYPMMYYPYQYPNPPPQHHMMVAPGAPPPAGYMPPQFMQPMPFPPQMPPNAAPGMYPPPPMAGMPPMAQGYMQPPPPGTTAYPPANGPRGSISPSPMPPHQMPYGYHQSPQMAHAHPVPYPMMMPPPGPTGPPHAYEGQPPIPGPMGSGH